MADQQSSAQVVATDYRTDPRGERTKNYGEKRIYRDWEEKILGIAHIWTTHVIFESQIGYENHLMPAVCVQLRCLAVANSMALAIATETAPALSWPKDYRPDSFITI
jgi:hypothetical protein